MGAREALDAASSSNIAEMFTAKELERILKIDVKTIYSYVQRGLIPYVRIQSNVRFPKADILDWVERQSVRPHAAGSNGGRRHAR